ncbi:MAG: hypothetical protein N2045_11690 [Fimbriimonadales bacterium]|mgnify:CR=1 FL=1|jgi:hypothetical protein|nr:hypothetical protein [Fimbriimonadales bacterium]GBC89617.1 hypothetical protein HRbin14_00343 [bacterium HR14]GIV12690.1 MAG: hypothetical protein KatS3mg021_0972 [Fimbriimonadales bacterium]CUU02485.1 TM2 domain [Armatimonadetes bacterium GBS]CUU37459.1 TM2 domain [Armatimonadetes bacterium GXS]
MNCYWHPHTPAVAQCTDCRKPLCEVCRVSLNTHPYCEACSANHHQQSPLAAFFFGLLVPGLGQIYNGEYLKGVLILLTGWLILPWIYGIVDAVVIAQAIAEGRRPAQGVPPGYLILALKIGVVFLSCLYFGVMWTVASLAHLYFLGGF